MQMPTSRCREHIKRQPVLRQPPAEVELVDMSPQAGRRSGGYRDDPADGAWCGEGFCMPSRIAGRVPTVAVRG